VERGRVEEEESGIQKEKENAEDMDVVDAVVEDAENDLGCYIVVLDKPSLLKS
jgi:hypothetical protein